MHYIYLKIRDDDVVTGAQILTDQIVNPDKYTIFYQEIEDKAFEKITNIEEILGIKDTNGYFNTIYKNGMFRFMNDDEKNIKNKTFSETEKLEQMVLDQEYRLSMLEIGGGIV